MGVELGGTVNKNIANSDYTNDDGVYILVFPKAAVGSLVNLIVGGTDGKGQRLEVVNNTEVAICRMPGNATDEFVIIVCKKGARDPIARRYYKIIKTSADRELAKMKKKLDTVWKQKEKAYQTNDSLLIRIGKLGIGLS